VILTILGVIILLLSIFCLPESYQPDPAFSLKPGPIIRNFWAVMQNRQFLVYALTGSLAFAGLFAYVSGSPIVFMDIYHVDKKVYGWIFAFLSVAFIGLSQFNTPLLKKYSSERISGLALVGQVTVAVIFLRGSIAGTIGLSQTIFFIFLFLGFLGFVNPNALALALAPFAKNAGSASALMGTLQMGIGALASIGVSVFSNGTATPMIAIMGATSVGAILILIVGSKKSSRK
jgi:DHA1 family bicyclomycin/chloramphenicol resistance-like MFS transporter